MEPAQLVLFLALWVSSVIPLAITRSMVSTELQVVPLGSGKGKKKKSSQVWLRMPPTAYADGTVLTQSYSVCVHVFGIDMKHAHRLHNVLYQICVQKYVYL